MLYHDSHGRLQLAREHADALARDYGRRRALAESRLRADLARYLSRRRRRRLQRARALSA